MYVYKYSIHIYLLCMLKENVMTLGKLIGKLFLLCPTFLSILFFKTKKIQGMSSLAL